MTIVEEEEEEGRGSGRSEAEQSGRAGEVEAEEMCERGRRSTGASASTAEKRRPS